jgi:hypothetical protein
MAGNGGIASVSTWLWIWFCICLLLMAGSAETAGGGLGWNDKCKLNAKTRVHSKIKPECFNFV